jgi:hypothetical protein
MIRHEPTAAGLTHRLSIEERVAIEMADEMHEALVNRSIRYLTDNSEIDDTTDAEFVVACRRKLSDAISITAITKMMLEVGTGSNGSAVFELSRGRGSQFLATVIKNDFENNPNVVDREQIIRAIGDALGL